MYRSFQLTHTANKPVLDLLAINTPYNYLANQLVEGLHEQLRAARATIGASVFGPSANLCEKWPPSLGDYLGRSIPQEGLILILRCLSEKVSFGNAFRPTSANNEIIFGTGGLMVSGTCQNS